MSRSWKSPIEVLTAWLPWFKYQEEHFSLGEHEIRIRTPKFLSRIYDRTEPGDRTPGISEAAFPLIGIVWPCGEVLAELMLETNIENRRILEIGCGMALPSHLLNKLGGDITAMDIHPVINEYLTTNAALNGCPVIPFVEASWSDPEVEIGHFDLIIGSDLLYEPRHVDHLAQFIIRNTSEDPEIIIADPDRGQAEKFIEQMLSYGFSMDVFRPAFMDSPGMPCQIRLLRFHRVPAD